MPLTGRGQRTRALTRETERGVESRRTPARCLKTNNYRPPRSGGGGVPKSDEECKPNESCRNRESSNNGRDARKEWEWITTSMDNISNSQSGWGGSTRVQRLRSKGRTQALGTWWTTRPHAGKPMVDSALLCQFDVVCIVNGGNPSEVTRT